MEKTKINPFTPGNPVPNELFVGRASQISELMRYIEQATLGKQENVFLVGDRGIGKTSISSFLKYWAQNKKEILPIHVFLGGVNNLEEMVRKIYEELLKVSQSEKIFNKIRNLFGKFISDVNLFGISIKFSPPKDDLDNLVRNFPQSIHEVLNAIKEYKKAILIILDDLDDIVSVKEFANWYKSISDQIATNYSEFSLIILINGLPYMIDMLAKNQPSLMRIFRIIEIEKLKDEEVRDFFKKAFKKTEFEIDDEALDSLVLFSTGLPLIMQEIGDATFWKDKDGKINDSDALGGVLIAAERIVKKYLDPQVYRALRSSSYHSILRKLGTRTKPLEQNFNLKEISSHLTQNENKVLGNFLRKMKKIGIIEPDSEKCRGNYRFVNNIYPIYIWLEAKANVK